MSPFLLMAAGYMAENTAFFKNRSEAVPLMTSYLGDLTWPGKNVLPKAAQRMLHKLCKISARSARRSAVIPEKNLIWGASPPPPYASDG